MGSVLSVRQLASCSSNGVSGLEQPRSRSGRGKPLQGKCDRGAGRGRAEAVSISWLNKHQPPVHQLPAASSSRTGVWLASCAHRGHPPWQ
jgi:hypothetical protein